MDRRPLVTVIGALLVIVAGLLPTVHGWDPFAFFRGGASTSTRADRDPGRRPTDTESRSSEREAGDDRTHRSSTTDDRSSHPRSSPLDADDEGECAGPGQFKCPVDLDTARYHGGLPEPRCVANPRDCPCPVPGQLKCWHGSWYVCVSGRKKCPKFS